MGMWLASIYLILIWMSYIFVLTDGSYVTATDSYGQIPDYDVKAKPFNDEDHTKMITSVHVYLNKYENYHYISCLGFTYGDIESQCRGTTFGEKKTIPLADDEFITGISGEAHFYVNQIKFMTNKERELGPFGPTTGAYRFSASNNGTPLFYVSGFAGFWLYQIKFHFFVTQLQPLANQIAAQVFYGMGADVDVLITIQHKYDKMIQDAASKGCSIDTVEVQPICDLETLLQQLRIIVNNYKAIIMRKPRSLLEFTQYDIREYLRRLDDGKEFHNLLTNVRLDLQTVVNVTSDLGKQLRNYFTGVAEFDQNVARVKKDDIIQRLSELKKGTEACMTKIRKGLPMVLGEAVGLWAAKAVEHGIQLANALASNFNPLKHLFGNTDLGSIMDKMEKFATTMGKLAKAGKLLYRLNELKENILKVQKGLAKGSKKLQKMRYLVENFANLKEEEIIPEAEKIISLDTSTGVTDQEIVKTVTLLGKIVETSCGLIAEAGVIGIFPAGSVATILGQTFSPDYCSDLPADIAELKSFYNEWLGMQSEFEDTLVEIVRGHVAKSYANNLQNVGAVIDIKQAAIGTIMMEIKLQAAARDICNVYEYNNGGIRPTICKTLLFKENQIDALISYVGIADISSNDVDFAYIPTTPSGTDGQNYIDINQLLKGKMVRFQLPDDKAWLKQYNWIPNSHNEETVYFVKQIDLYIPGLVCSQGSVDIFMESEKRTKLYSQPAPPTYFVENHVFSLRYTEREYCANEKRIVPIKDQETGIVQNQAEVCVISEGKGKTKEDKILPTLFSGWMIHLHNKSCSLESQDGYTPMITAYIKMDRVFAFNSGGSDECWPNPCKKKACIDDILSFRCED